jgi:Tol biopolymer transport system component
VGVRVSRYLCASDLQVGKLTRLAGGTPDNQNKYPAFSPDGTMIAYASNRDGNGANNEIYVVDRDGQDAAAPSDQQPGGRHLPTWSPTGTQSRSSRPDRQELPYVMSSDGLNVDSLSSIRAIGRRGRPRAI